jgi:hypothetical protein
MVRLLMREARRSPTAISFRTVEGAHWSFAPTCATDSSLVTGIFSARFHHQGGRDGQNIARELCC